MKPSELIRKHGWCQGYLRDDKGGFCLLGAIEEHIDYGVGWADKVSDIKLKLQREIKRRIPTNPPGITIYNDRYIDSQEQAVEILEAIGE